MSKENIGQVRIYGCGGMGMNIAQQYETFKHLDGYALPNPVYFDTSKANVRETMDRDNLFTLEGVDGSGKKRTTNKDEISAVIRSALQQHAPLDLNIVVFSCAGGSGSVFGPLVVKALLERGERVVVVAAGSETSAIEAKNTIDTLKGLEAISHATDRPVVAYYEHNDRTTKRSAVDNSMVYAVSSLLMLASGQNDEMDSEDLTNFLDFHKVTSVGPRLAMLNIFSSGEKLNKHVRDPLTIASLYNEADDDRVDATPEYQSTGYLHGRIKDIDQLHFTVSIESVQSISKNATQVQNKMADQHRSRVDAGTILGKNDVVDGTGLVF